MKNIKFILPIFLSVTFSTLLFSNNLENKEDVHSKSVPEYIKIQNNMIVIDREDSSYRCDMELINCEEYDFIENKWKEKSFTEFKNQLKQLFLDSKENF